MKNRLWLESFRTDHQFYLTMVKLRLYFLKQLCIIVISARFYRFHIIRQTYSQVKDSENGPTGDI